MRAQIPDLAAEIIAQIQDNISEYARPTDPGYQQTIRRGVEQALFEFVGRVGQLDGALDTAAEVHRAIGRAELRAGRSLDALHAAYRTGARLAWRRWAEVGSLAGVPPSQMYRLADAVFAHIEELAEHAAEGYFAARGSAGERQRQRLRLLGLLVAEPRPSATAVEGAARAAHWRLPAAVTAVALEGDRALPPDLPGDVLADLSGPRPFLLVPSSEQSNRVNWITRWLPRDWVAAVGPTKPLVGAPASLRLARQTLDLVRRGVIARPREGVVHGGEHTSTLLLLQDEALVAELTERFLGPLAPLTPKQQERTVDTVLAWLSCRGGAPEVAQLLGVHPQTVRYRLRQAEDVFGAELLRDPTVRLDFEMALRARQLLDRASAGVGATPPRQVPARTGSSSV